MSLIQVVGKGALPVMFHFERQVLEDELRRRVQLARDSTSEVSLLASLSNADSFRLRDWPVGTRLVAGLLTLQQGSVWCPRCSKEHSAQTLRTMQYEVELGAISGGAGRKFFCPSDHELLDIVDRRS